MKEYVYDTPTEAADRKRIIEANGHEASMVRYIGGLWRVYDLEPVA